MDLAIRDYIEIGFEDGAQWSRTETIAEILGMLRAEEPDADGLGFWIDFIERQLKEGK